MFAITNARLFDGERNLAATTLLVDGRLIRSIGCDVPPGVDVVDADGGTLLPGLIDSHVHTYLDGLQDALRFGVTTELEMMGFWKPEDRAMVRERDDIADIRSAGFGVTAPNGHPSELHKRPTVRRPGAPLFTAPTASSPDEAAEFIAARVAEGADYIKVMVEEGSVLGAPGLPMLTNATLCRAVSEAHKHGKIAIAHALTLAATEQAVAAGVDGLSHVFIDRLFTEEIVRLIASSGVFVTPCLTLNASIMGQTGKDLAADPRVGSKLSPEWMDTLCSCFNTFPQGDMDTVFATVAALHQAGVDILAGTDVSRPQKHLGGLAHGASLHHELQLLVAAGLTPIQALSAATSVPARRFGLGDRGRLARGLRADLVLVDGDPTSRISDSLSVKAVWRRGVRLASLDAVQA